MEKKFEWNDDLVLEFNRFINNSPAFESIADGVHKFKESKQPKPEYEVLELVHNRGTKCHFDSRMIDAYGNRESWVKFFLGANCGWQISKVKRLSDGEVFAIGDKLTQQYWNGQIRDITGFGENSLDGYGIMATTSPGSVRVNIKSETVKKVPARVKLFTTYDGKDIFEGERVVLLSTHSWDMNINVLACNRPFPGDKGQFLYFSTEQAANDYIILNKPCLSVKEVGRVLNLNWLDRHILFSHIKIKNTRSHLL